MIPKSFKLLCKVNTPEADKVPKNKLEIFRNTTRDFIIYLEKNNNFSL
jgi:hypothetical protein